MAGRGDDGAPARGRAPFREESSIHKAERGLAGPLLVRPLFADEEADLEGGSSSEPHI